VNAARLEKLTTLMAWAANGDRAAAFMLRVEFGHELKAAVRAAAAEVGRRLPSDEVEAVATDFCIWLTAHAKAWRPGAALPWRWAWSHLKAEVRRNTGFWPLAVAEPCEVRETTEVVAVIDDENLLDTVARLAAHEPRVAALLCVLEAVSTPPGDVALLLDLAEQRSAGDPSPSHTVAPRYGLSPDAARKRAQRVRDRAHQFIAEHPEYRDVAELPVLAKVKRAGKRHAA
jgi:hypothetical protein